MPNKTALPPRRAPHTAPASGIDWVTLGAAATGIALAATIAVASGVTGAGPATGGLTGTLTRAE